MLGIATADDAIDRIHRANDRIDAVLWSVEMEYPDRIDAVALTEAWAETANGVTGRLVEDVADDAWYVGLFRFAPGAELRPHVHSFHEDVWVMRGDGTMRIGTLPGRADDGARYHDYEIAPGGYFIVPQEVPHATVAGPEGCLLLVRFYQPGSPLPPPPAAYAEADVVAMLRRHGIDPEAV